jgi:hypothetical protein
MMHVQITVEGPTFAALQQTMDITVSSFLTGAPSGTTATLTQINPAVKIGDDDAGWDAGLGKVLTLPRFQVTYTWEVVQPGDPEPGQVITVP